MRLYSAIALAIIFASHGALALEPGQYPPCKQAGVEYSEGATIWSYRQFVAASAFLLLHVLRFFRPYRHSRNSKRRSGLFSESVALESIMIPWKLFASHLKATH